MVCTKSNFIQITSVLLGIIYYGQNYDDGSHDDVMNINAALFLMIVDQTFSNMMPVLHVSSNASMLATNI